MSHNFYISIFAAVGLLCAISTPAHAVPFSPGDFLSYTQAEWGDPPNPAAQLLTTNYVTVYAPFGVVAIGITNGSGFSITFDNAADLVAYLPAVGPAGPLNSNSVDPTTTASGTFGGEAAALRLNVDFSDANLLAHLPGVPFGNLRLTGFSGSLAGLNEMPVRDFLGVINNALGGGLTPYTISDLDGVALQLNAAFFNGIPLDWAETHLELPRTTAPIPESATWVLMLAGFGAICFACRGNARVEGITGTE
jgi:hypothetical protein